MAPFTVEDGNAVPMEIDEANKDKAEQDARGIYTLFLAKENREAELQGIPEVQHKLTDEKREELSGFLQAVWALSENGEYTEKAHESLRRLPTYEQYARAIASGEYKP